MSPPERNDGLEVNAALQEEANDMIHDDPSKKDATKNPPDRGGGRWTAFSLAARGGSCVSDVARYGPSMARLFLRAVGVGVTCTLVSACVGTASPGMAVDLFSYMYLCPADQIAVRPLGPPTPSANFEGSYSMWRKRYAGSYGYQLKGCGHTTEFLCHRLGKCVAAGM